MLRRDFPRLEISTASSAAEAKTLMDAFEYDLVITDWFLSGSETAETLIKNNYHMTPIVVMTAAEDRVKENAPNVELWSKPLKINKVRQSVTQVLQVSQIIHGFRQMNEKLGRALA